MPRLSRSRRSALLPPLAALVVIATACPEEPSRRTLPTAPPPAEGTLRLGYPEEPPSLNPVTDTSPASRDLLRPVLPSFFLVTPDLRYEPYLLAEEPGVRRDGDRTEVRFRIRDDAVWSDGTPITVADVSFTWRVATEASLAVARPDGFDHLVDVVGDSPKVGRLVLEPHLAAWRELFSAGRFVLPAHAASAPMDVEGWDRGPPITAGPFRLDGRVPGRSLTFAADPRFWGPPPELERIEVAFVPDPTTALHLLRRGDLDALAPMLGISWGRRLDELPGVSVSRAAGPHVVAVAVNVSRVPEEDVRVGIDAAIDRLRFDEAVLRDEGSTAQSVLAPEQRGFAPAWDVSGESSQPPLAGTPELDLIFPRGELMDLTARYVREEVRAAGGDVELVPLDADVYQDMFLAERRFDLALVEVRTGPSPGLWRWVQARGAARPLTELRVRELAGLLDVADAGGDAADGALAEAQERLAELAAVVPLYHPATTVAWRDGVRGLEANATVEGPFWNAWAWSVAA